VNWSTNCCPSASTRGWASSSGARWPRASSPASSAGEAPPAGSRRAALGDTGTLDAEQGFRVLDVLGEIASDRGVSIAQAAINWLIQRPGVSSVIIGARTEDQLKDNLGAADWRLTEDEVTRLDRVSARPLPYPYWHQQKFNAPRMRYTLLGAGLE
jgi:hypothetical protein